MSDDPPIDLLADIGRTITAMAQQWRHRIQVARREARDTATARGMLSSSIRYSLEGRAITSAVEAMIPEAVEQIESHLKGAITAAELPSPERLLQAVEPTIHQVIESEVTELRASARRKPFASDISDGTITAAVAGIEPAFSILRSRILTALQNRRAKLIAAQRTVDAATPKPKQESRLQRWLRLAGIARTVWWLVGAIIGVGLWAWKGLPLPF